jgi:hypothetical protein
MNSLRELIKQYRNLAAEKSSTIQMRDKAQIDIDQVIDEGELQSPRQQKKLGDARFALDLAVSRLKAIDKVLPKLIKEIDATYTFERREFNSLFRERIADVIEEMLTLWRPYYIGNERLLKNQFKSLHVPAIHELTRAQQERPYDPTAGEEAVVDYAEQFCVKAKRLAALHLEKLEQAK